MEELKQKIQDKMNDLAKINESILQYKGNLKKLEQSRIVYLNQIDSLKELGEELNKEKDDAGKQSTAPAGAGDLPGGSD